jgi:protein SCO1/2
MPRIALVAGALALLIGGSALAVVTLAERGSQQVPSLVIGGPFALTDQNGKAVTDADYKGAPFLVFFGYTHCPEICPTTLYEISEVLNGLGDDARHVRALFITVDPARDTPAVLKDYVSNFNPQIVGLTGTQAQIDAATRAYHAYAAKVDGQGSDYAMDHTAVVYLMDKNGSFVRPFNLQRKEDEAAAELRRYF